MSTGFANDPYNPLLPQNPAAVDMTGASIQNSRRGGKRKGERANKSSTLLHFLGLTMEQWVAFTVVQVLFFFVYHDSQIAVNVATLCIGLFFATTALTITTRLSHTAFGGFLGLLALAVSYWAGRMNYYTYLNVYWGYVENQEYTAVVPTDNAARFSDAGRLFFTADTRVQVDLGVGFRHNGQMYCVAPIMNSGPLNKVSFWAVGVNCCDKRNSFDCDDAHNAKAHGGVVVPPSDDFSQAIKKAEADNDLSPSSSPLLVRWVANPDGVINAQRTYAVSFMVIAIAVYLVVSVILASVSFLALRYANNAKYAERESADV